VVIPANAFADRDCLKEVELCEGLEEIGDSFRVQQLQFHEAYQISLNHHSHSQPCIFVLQLSN
jgi:hypothetical protein